MSDQGGNGAFFAIHGLHATALQIIVASVERFAGTGEFLEISGHCIFDDIVGRTACLCGKLLDPGLDFRMEVKFHGVSLDNHVFRVKVRTTGA